MESWEAATYATRHLTREPHSPDLSDPKVKTAETDKAYSSPSRIRTREFSTFFFFFLTIIGSYFYIFFKIYFIYLFGCTGS